MRRFSCETADWHVFARGARRLQLFRDNEDFERFLRFLAYSLKKSGCTLWAFALMTNHYHLALRGSSRELTSCMRRLNGLYSRYHNHKYGLDGHTFDGPYQAFRQATSLLLLHCMAYIFFNPVKAGLCSKPEDYPWTCVRSYIGVEGSPWIVDPDALIAHLGVGPQAGWARFHQAMEQEARRPERLRPGKLSMQEVHARQFEWLLEQTKSEPGWPTDEERDLVAIHRARLVGIAPKVIGSVLGCTSASIRNRMYRFHARLRRDPDLRAKAEHF
jgi:REP element-mobilizing transposase RayT